MTRVLGTVAAVAALVLSAGCTNDSDDPSSAGKASGGGTEKVTYLTGASILGREAFVFVAIEKGYFKQAGLEVEVQAGKGTAPNLTLLQSGKVDFAALDITAALIEYGKGTFKDFTIVNAIQQRNLQCIMTLEGRGITSPKDLAGKKIAYLPGGVAKTLFPAYAKLAGIDESKIQWVNIPLEQHPQNVAAGTVDAATQFAVGKPGIERVGKGKKAVVLPYTDFLTDLYGVGVGVAKKQVTENPDRIRRFNEALLKGLRDAIENPAEAGKIYAKYQKIQPEPVAIAENNLMVPYVKSAAGGAAVGALDPQRVARNIAIVQGAGVIPSVFDPLDVVSVDFLPKS
ncbi:ABC transporter substrate-binding protein [Paractinoplanes rishiriensis]|uniref:ABC transporter substrate-binding protein n=1 Tax=Paractinoplanes rishiriensis TaxID=1050105 RepID=UPI001EF25F01|nr:ABC transporter substrate-binding protein [Actinoplanes rishiriensis]